MNKNNLKKQHPKLFKTCQVGPFKLEKNIKLRKICNDHDGKRQFAATNFFKNRVEDIVKNTSKVVIGLVGSVADV